MIDCPGVVIVGNDTEIGKTTIACQIIEGLRERGVCVGAFKPAASGYSDNDDAGDIRRLISASGRDLRLDEVCPYRFSQAIAPVMAARECGVSFDNHIIESRLKAMATRSDFIVIETAGGLMSPLSAETTNLDFCRAIRLASIVVIENRLGAINQANLVCHALIASKQQIAAVIFNQTKDGKGDLLDNNVRLFAEMFEDQFATAASQIHSVGFQGKVTAELINQLPHSRRLGL